MCFQTEHGFQSQPFLGSSLCPLHSPQPWKASDDCRSHKSELQEHQEKGPNDCVPRKHTAANAVKLTHHFGSSEAEKPKGGRHTEKPHMHRTGNVPLSTHLAPPPAPGEHPHAPKRKRHKSHTLAEIGRDSAHCSCIPSHPTSGFLS